MEDLLGKYFSGEATAKEVDEIKKWRSSNDENARFFLEAKSAWQSTVTYEPPANLLQSILNDHAKVVDINTQSEPTSGGSWMRYAAVISLLLVAGFAGWFVLNDDVSLALPATPPMASAIILEDGSTLTLYKGSTYEVVDMNENERVVRVNGKAYFDVERDESRPFTIYANNAKVQVLGTSFTIDTDSDTGTEVMVESGKVSVSHNPETFEGTSESVFLEKGEMGIVASSRDLITKKRIDDQNYLSWSSGILSFKEDNLAEVGKLMKEVYGLDVQFENENLGNCQLTAKFNKKSAEEIIQIISSTFDIKSRITNDRVVFSGKGC